MEGDRPLTLPHRGSGSVQGALSAGPKGGWGPQNGRVRTHSPPLGAASAPHLRVPPTCPAPGVPMYRVIRVPPGISALFTSSPTHPPTKKSLGSRCGCTRLAAARTPPLADAPGPGKETGNEEHGRRPAPGCSSVPPGARGAQRGPGARAVSGRPRPPPERASWPGGAPCRPPRAPARLSPGSRRGGAAAPPPTPGAGQACCAAAQSPAAFGLSCLTAQARRCAPAPLRCSAVVVLSGRRVSVWQYVFFLCQL